MELMTTAPLNAELSRKVYRTQQDQCQPRMCYNNIYRAVTDYMHKLHPGEWKIAYGYYTLDCQNGRILARHAFLLDEENSVIDPTIYAHNDSDLTHKYHVMYVFSNIEEYLCAIEQEKYYPALVKYLRDHDRKANRWAVENGYYLLG